MKYLKIKRAHPQYGYKEGDVIQIKDKIPPDLERYAIETTQGVYDKYMEGMKDEADRLEDERNAKAAQGDQPNAEATSYGEEQPAKSKRAKEGNI